MDLKQRIQQHRESLEATYNEYLQSKNAVAIEEEKLEEVTNEIEDIEQAQKILQSIAQEIQQQAHVQIAGIVSKCLSVVFDDPYEFRIKFEQKRGKTEASMVFVRNGMEVNPRKAAGGAVVDVAAFALRLACLSLRQPKARKLIVMDEPFRQKHASIRPRVVSMLETLAESLNFQFIIVTHEDQLKAGKVIEIK